MLVAAIMVVRAVRQRRRRRQEDSRLLMKDHRSGGPGSDLAGSGSRHVTLRGGSGGSSSRERGLGDSDEG